MCGQQFAKSRSIHVGANEIIDKKTNGLSINTSVKIYISENKIQFHFLKYQFLKVRKTVSVCGVVSSACVSPIPLSLKDTAHPQASTQPSQRSYLSAMSPSPAPCFPLCSFPPILHCHFNAGGLHVPLLRPSEHHELQSL